MHPTALAPRLIGYARVSTDDQLTRAQVDALEKAGCSQIFTEHASGAQHSRPQLAAALAVLRPGDSLVVWRLDRLGRSLPHLIETVRQLEAGGVELVSLSEAIDTTTATGTLLFHLLASLAEFERGLARERTMLGLQAAAARGQRGGRPAALAPEQVKVARQLREEGRSFAEIARAVGGSKSSVHRALTKYVTRFEVNGDTSAYSVAHERS